MYNKDRQMDLNTMMFLQRFCRLQSQILSSCVAIPIHSAAWHRGHLGTASLFPSKLGGFVQKLSVLPQLRGHYLHFPHLGKHREWHGLIPPRRAGCVKPQCVLKSRGGRSLITIVIQTSTSIFLTNRPPLIYSRILGRSRTGG